jgi:glucosamine 6-phosphate synthetase-like amidotransferase/phosphosugar isomerase protein
MLPNKMLFLTDALACDAGCVSEVLKLDFEMKELASSLIDSESLLVFGRSYNYTTTLEGTLKVKDVALMHNEGMLEAGCGGRCSHS